MSASLMLEDLMNEVMHLQLGEMLSFRYQLQHDWSKDTTFLNPLIFSLRLISKLSLRNTVYFIVILLFSTIVDALLTEEQSDAFFRMM